MNLDCGMASAKNKIEVIPSSGNVFADLGLPNAEERQTKARLAVAINEIIRSQRLGRSPRHDLAELITRVRDTLGR